MKINTELTMSILNYSNTELLTNKHECLKIYYNSLLYDCFNPRNRIFVTPEFLNENCSFTEIELMNFKSGRINLRKLTKANNAVINLLRIYDSKGKDYKEIFYEFDYLHINLKDNYSFEISNCEKQFISIFFDNQIVYHFIYENRILMKIDFSKLKYILDLFLYPFLKDIKLNEIPQKEISDNITTILVQQLKIKVLLETRKSLINKEISISDDLKTEEKELSWNFNIFSITLLIINTIILFGLFINKMYR